MMLSILSVLVVLTLNGSLGFIPQKWQRSSSSTSSRLFLDNAFDGKEFEDALKSIGPMMGKQMNAAEDQDISNLRKEQISRTYPFDDYSQQLPTLPDCNSYYSGKYLDYTWHQNADQVYVYIPIPEETSKRDIDVKFEALGVKLMINDKEIVKFDTLERIIPDGSFWVLETGMDGKKYLMLDLEKRLRMINWKNIFGPPPIIGKQETDETRRKMLETLFSANKGMSKLTGKEPESIADMQSNKELMDMLGRDVSENAMFPGNFDLRS